MKVCLKDIIALTPSESKAVIYKDIEKNITKSITYSEFIAISQKLSNEISNISRKHTGTTENPSHKRLIGISCKPTLELPIVVYTLVQNSYAFLPLSLDLKDLRRSLTCIQNTSVNWLLLGSCQLENLTKITESGEIVIRQQKMIKAIPDYLLIEMVVDNVNVIDQDIVYVVHTSGTTGEPKSIRVTDDCIAPNVSCLRRIWNVTNSDVILLSSSITFDASLVQMVLSWSSQAVLLVTPLSTVLSRSKEFVENVLSEVTILQCTPSLLCVLGLHNLKKTIFTKTPTLRVLALGGEQFLPKSHFINLTENSQQTIKYYNIYGISEVSSWASIYLVTKTDLINVSRSDWMSSGDKLNCLEFTNEQSSDGLISMQTPSSDYVNSSTAFDCDWLPIGEPLSETWLEVRSDDGMLLNGSGYGELFICSKVRTTLMGNDTMSNAPNLRSSSDIVYVRQDKRIFICGRKGTNIKRNGKIVSLAALANIGNSIEDVENCICVCDKQSILIFVKLGINIDSKMEVKLNKRMKKVERTFIEHIHTKLSSSYLPDKIIFVENIPLTSHGKIDKYELLRLNTAQQHQNQPSISLNQCVKELWGITLNLKHSSSQKTSNSTFTQLGGSSFSALYFLNGILKHFPSLVNVIQRELYEAAFSTILTSTLTDIINFFEELFVLTENNDKEGEIIEEKNQLFLKIDSKMLTLKNSDLKIHLNKEKFYVEKINVCETQPIESIGNKDHQLDSMSQHSGCEKNTDEQQKPSSSCRHHIAYKKQNIQSSCLCLCTDLYLGKMPLKRSYICTNKDRFNETCNPNSCCKTDTGSNNYSCQHGPDFHDHERKTHMSIYEYSKKTDTNDLQNKIDDSNYIEIKTKWKHNLGKCIDASPIIVFSDVNSGGVVYVGCHSRIFAGLMLHCGTRLWNCVVDDRIESSAEISSDGLSVIFGCYDGCLYMVNSMTGFLEWTFKTHDQIKGSPAMYRHLVIFASHDKFVYALNIHTKQLQWKYQTNSGCSSAPCLDPVCSSAYITLLSGRLISLDLNYGLFKWDFSVGKPIFTSPCLCRDLIIFGSVDGGLYAINSQGVQQWKYSVDGPIFSSPTVINSIHADSEHLLVFGCNDCSLYCLTDRGALLWRFKTKASVVASVGVFVGKSSDRGLKVSGITNSANLNNTDNVLVELYKEKDTKKQISIEKKSVRKRALEIDIKDSKYRTKYKQQCKEFLPDESNQDIEQNKHSPQYKGLDAVGLCSENIEQKQKHPENRRDTYAVYSDIHGEVGLVDVKSGECRTTYQCGGDVFSSPVVVDDLIVIGCRDDNVYCLQILV